MHKLLPLFALAFAAGWLVRGACKPAAPAPAHTPTNADVLARYLNQPYPSVLRPTDLMPSWSVDDPHRPPAGPLR